MLQGLAHRQQQVQTIQQCASGHRALAFHLASGQADQEHSGLFGEGALLTHQSPDQRTGLTGNQQPFEQGKAAFLLPLFELLACPLEQLEVGFDAPAPVVPQGQALSRHLGHIAQQVPFSQQLSPGVQDSTDHQPGRQRLSRLRGDSGSVGVLAFRFGGTGQHHSRFGQPLHSGLTLVGDLPHLSEAQVGCHLPQRLRLLRIFDP
ncbi:hypothetical protein D9M69_485730 [compost metagenome]